MSDFIVSARKYRPQGFDSVVGQPVVSNTLKKAISSGQIAHAYLFCGPRGVGKTTCARIFAKTLNCFNPTEKTEACGVCESCVALSQSRSYNIHELDAASNNSVEDIRSLIEKVRVHPQVGKYSIYIIDEVHMLSQSAFNAFLKTLEEPPAHAVFILATTEKHKIIPTILSRCQVFDFSRISVNDISSYLAHIAKQEGIDYDDEALHVIAVKADGAMRDALSIFDQAASFSGNKIRYKDVVDNLNVLDYEYFFRMVDFFLSGSSADVLLLYDEVLKKGYDGLNFVNGLSAHIRDLLVSTDPQTIKLLEAGDSVREKYLKQSAECNPGFLLSALEICNQCEMAFKLSKNQRLHVELALLRMCVLKGEKKNLKNNAGKSGEKLIVTAEKVDNKTNNHNNSVVRPNRSEINESVDKYKNKAERISIKEALDSLNKKDKNIVKQIEDNDNVTIEDINIQEPEIISADQLSVSIHKYAVSIKEKRPRMAAALRNIIPSLSENNKIIISLNNKTQLDDFNSGTKSDLEDYLREDTGNLSISIDAVLEEIEEDSNRKLYTNEEKFNFLTGKNPLLSMLKQELNLEIE